MNHLERRSSTHASSAPLIGARRRAIGLAICTALLFVAGVYPAFEPRAKVEPVAETGPHVIVEPAASANDAPASGRRADGRASREIGRSAAPATESKAPRSLEDVAAQLESRFQSAPPASTEMMSAEAAFRAAFTTGELTGASLSNVECRATICRAQVALADREADDAFTRRMFLDPTTRIDFGLDVSMPTRNHGAGGSIDATLYLFKAEPRPQPPEADPADPV